MLRFLTPKLKHFILYECGDSLSVRHVWERAMQRGEHATLQELKAWNRQKHERDLRDASERDKVGDR